MYRLDDLDSRIAYQNINPAELPRHLINALRHLFFIRDIHGDAHGRAAATKFCRGFLGGRQVPMPLAAPVTIATFPSKRAILTP